MHAKPGDGNAQKRPCTKMCFFSVGFPPVASPPTATLANLLSNPLSTDRPVQRLAVLALASKGHIIATGLKLAEQQRLNPLFLEQAWVPDRLLRYAGSLLP